MESSVKQLSWAKQQFERAVVKAEKALSNGNLLSAVVWAQIGADFASHRHPGFYTSTALESLLLDVASRLDRQTKIKSIGFQSRNDTDKMHVLHVMTEAYRTGGHTRVVERWIRNTADTAVHSLLTTAQRRPLPDSLASSIVATGGWYHSLAVSFSNPLHRSVLLRQISRNWADVVVLHIHPFDALPIVAFGIEGGPPVILFNHADHVFWLGTSVADVVADFRPLGQRLTLSRRGVRNSRILPLPLLKAKSGPSYQAARKQLGIKNGTTVLLTIGSSHKYTSFAGYDFVGTMVKILCGNSKATLIAIGPRHHGRWAEESALVNGRIRALGVQTNLELFYACADIYLPSFPLGSLTAMLDAGARGLPIIGLCIPEAPKLCGADDISLDTLETHTTSLEEYTALVERMIAEPTLRNKKGAQIKERIAATHLPPGWNSFLEDVMRALPTEHTVRLQDASNLPMDSADILLAAFNTARPIPHSFSRSVREHVEYLPTWERMRSYIEALKETSGTQTQLSKASLHEGTRLVFELLPTKMKLTIRSKRHKERKIKERSNPSF